MLKYFLILLLLIVLFVVFIAYKNRQFEKEFKNDVATSLQSLQSGTSDLVSEQDLHHLPKPVQKYLRFTGVLNQPKVHNMKIVFKGEMRRKGEEWFNFTSEQFNIFDDPQRLFFMKAKVKGLPTSGYHSFKNGEAGMLIKILSFLPVADVKGEEINQAETVTFFNDMCLFAPAALIDKRIVWETIDEHSVKAIFNHKGISISAILHFEADGRLTNFISDDRYADTPSGMRKYCFSTPIREYKTINGLKLGTYGEAIWHFPDGPFVYGKFHLQEITYNYSKNS